MSIYCLIEDCDRFAFINGKCYSHDKEEKREAKEKLKVKKVYKISAKSKKKAKEDREYNKGAGDWFEANPKCKARLEGCTDKTDDRHHVSGRGANTNDRGTWLPVCRSCHQMIHNVMSAKERRDKHLLI
jgi:hypothetical protein